MKRALWAALAALFFCLTAHAQWTTVTAANVQNAKGDRLARGRLCFRPVDTAGHPISFVGAGGQTVSAPACFEVTNGAIPAGSHVLDTAQTTPAHVCYAITIRDHATGKLVLGGDASAGYDCAQPSGAAWSLDSYQPNLAPTATASNVASLEHGGTGNNNWTPARCVRVSNDGVKLEAAPADCGAGGGPGGTFGVNGSGISNPNLKDNTDVHFTALGSDVTAAIQALPISRISGLQTALDAKANDSAVLHSSGDETVTGRKSFENLNGVRFADQYAGADAGAKIQACVTELGSTRGICDARGFTGGTLSSFTVQPGVTVFLSVGNYTVTGTINVRSGGRLIGVLGHSNGQGTVLTAANGLNAPIIAVNTIPAGDWWHWGAIENLHLKGNSANQTSGSCLKFEEPMGEASYVRNLYIEDCKQDGILVGSTTDAHVASQAPAHFENIALFENGRYGFNCDGCAGTMRMIGLSGDDNATAYMHVNGQQSLSLTIVGLKTETKVAGVQDDILLLEGSAPGAAPTIHVLGGSCDPSSGATTNYVHIINNAVNLHLSDLWLSTTITNVIKDDARSITVPTSLYNGFSAAGHIPEIVHYGNTPSLYTAGANPAWVFGNGRPIGWMRTDGTYKNALQGDTGNWMRLFSIGMGWKFIASDGTTERGNMTDAGMLTLKSSDSSGKSLILDKYDATEGGEMVFTGNTKDWHLDNAGGQFRLMRHAPNGGSWENNAMVVSTSGNVTFSGQGIFNGGVSTGTLATGTAPYQTSSTTLNTNLNADMLDDKHASDIIPTSISCAGTDKLRAYDSSTHTFTCDTDQGGAGSGDNISVNGSAATDANFGNMPAAEANYLLCKWQIDTSASPDNVSLECPYGNTGSTFVVGNDARLSDARTPTTHASSHVTGGGDVIANAVASGNAGLMAGADKAKLDGIASGAEVNVNADWNAVSGDAQILNKPALPANEAGSANNYLSAYNSTTGAWTKSRPSCGILSDSGGACTLGTGTLTNGQYCTYVTGTGLVCNSTPGGSGTVTHTAGALTSGAVVIGNGAADIKVDTGCSTDGTGALTCASFTTTGSGADLYTEIAAPASPAAGKGSLWYDSTDHRLHDKNSSGTVGTTVVADTGAANNFLTAISAAGAISKARPTCANLSDSGTTCPTSPDGSTLEISSTTLRVKDAGITLAKLTAAALVRPFRVVINGSGSSGVLQDADDVLSAWSNGYGTTWKVSAISACRDGGGGTNPTIMVSKANAGADLLTGNITISGTCSTDTYTAGTLVADSGANRTIADGSGIDIKIVAAGGTATEVHVKIVGSLQ